MIKNASQSQERILQIALNLRIQQYYYHAFDLFPIGYGYKLSENGESLEMHWFDGNQTPDSIEKLETDGDEGKNSDEDDADVGDSDSEDEESNDEFDDAQI